jgi:hypothetical protein
MKAISAAIPGVLAAAPFAVISGLDVRLVNGFRGTRTVPYRVAFFVVLAITCTSWAASTLSSGARSGPGRVVAYGLVSGYVSGLVAAAFVNFVLISPVGAWRSLTSGVDGVLIMMLVPLVTFSWLLGLLAFIAARMVVRQQDQRG